jgi:hypothetical protein
VAVLFFAGDPSSQLRAVDALSMHAVGCSTIAHLDHTHADVAKRPLVKRTCGSTHTRFTTAFHSKDEARCSKSERLAVKKFCGLVHW